MALIGQSLFHRPKSQQRRLTLVSVNRKMASRKLKEKKLKKAKSLEEDASKCKKLTELFGSSATASSSSNVDVGQSMLSENQVDFQPAISYSPMQIRLFTFKRNKSLRGVQDHFLVPVHPCMQMQTMKMPR